MSHLFKFLTITILAINFLACKNDSPERDEATAAVNEELAAQNAPLSPEAGKLAITSDTALIADNNKTVNLPPLGDTSLVTLLIIRHAENMEGKTSLSNLGLNRAGHLAGLMEKVKLSQIYVDGNSGLQTGFFSAQPNKAEVNTFDGTQLESFLQMVNKDFRGQRILIVGTQKSVPAMVNMLVGKTVEGKMPENDYDHFFAAKVKTIGDAEVTHFRY